MRLNENKIKGKWLEIKGDIQKAWGKVTNDDLEKTKGDIKSIGGIVQQKVGDAQGVYDKKVKDALQNVEEKKDETLAEIKRNLKS